MIVQRPFWQSHIEESWLKKNIIWLMGVRRVGKTSLCRSLQDIVYYDCERPRVRALLSDPETFLEEHHGKRLVLDEIHRLDNPSELLKLAADHYQSVHIIATGSSTLGANSKFRDTLAGRKIEIWLTPLMLEEGARFGSSSMQHRITYGGLPPFFVQQELPDHGFTEWMNAYLAKDIQEHFAVGKRFSFHRCAELLLAQSGGSFEATRFAALCEVSRPTIHTYVQILEETFVLHVVRPFSTHKQHEIVKAPKIYGFDTGFVCHAKGIRELRAADIGLLWKHLVLNELHAHLQTRSIMYWRSKHGHDVDFIFAPRRYAQEPIAIECKYSFMHADDKRGPISKNIAAFRENYPEGPNYIVCHDVEQPFKHHHNGITLSFVRPEHLIQDLIQTYYRPQHRAQKT